MDAGTNTKAPPTLAPPGRGLPLWERLSINYVALPRFFRATTWEQRVAMFEKNGRRVLEVAAANEGRLLERALVPRLPGLEDSSRYWSVSMVMEHLITVGSDMAELIVQLTLGQVPDRLVSIAAYKPKGAKTAEAQRAEFDAFLADFRHAMTTRVGDPRSRTTFRHPWFGRRTAGDWLGIAALHQALHRKQAQLIAAQLKG